MTESKLNRLEKSILNAEDSAEDARWLQAQEVVRRLDADETEREIAASWTNLRTGKPYGQKHINRCARLWRTFESVPTQDRPLWHKVYDDQSSTRSERNQAQPPATVETARKLVDNVMKSASAEVQDTIYHEIRLARAGEDRSPAARKSAAASAESAVAPLKRAAASGHESLCVQALDEARDSVRELIAEDALTSKGLTRIDNATNRFLEVLAEARFGLGVDA